MSRTTASSRRLAKRRHELVPVATAAAAPALPGIPSSHSLNWPLFLALLAAAVALVIFPVGQGEEDIWWHLKTGDWILQNKRIPTEDIFTHTNPPGTRWVDTQWFFQAVAAQIYHTAGWNGLIAFRLLGVAALIALCWQWLRALGYTPMQRLLAVSVFYLGCWFRFTARPELPTFIFLAAQLWLYHESRTKPKMALPLIVFIQLLWANWHSSCVLGLGLPFVFMATELWENRRVPRKQHGQNVHAGDPFGDERRRPQIRILLAFALAIVAATMLNPNGWKVPVYALTESSRGYVIECRRPDAAFFLSASGLVLALGALGVWSRTGRTRLFDVLVMLLFSVQAFRMIRFFPYFAVPALPLLAEGSAFLIWRIGALGAVRRSAAAIAILALIALGAFLSYRMEPHPLLRTGMRDKTAPVAAADFIGKEKLTGRLYNEFNTGGYLLWRLAPERKVFVFAETRLNAAITDRAARTYFPEDWRSFFAEYNVTYAVLNCTQGALLREGDSTAKMIYSSWPDWKLVFWDDIAMVFAKDVPENRELISRRACRIFPEPIPYRLNPAPDVPALMAMLSDSSSWPEIERELARAIADSPEHFRAALALGNLREMRKDDPAKCFEAYAMAEKADPDSAEIQQCLANWHLNYGSPQKAAMYEEKALAAGAQGPEVLCVLASAQMKMGRAGEARRNVQRCLGRYPGHPWAMKLSQELATVSPAR